MKWSSPFLPVVGVLSKISRVCTLVHEFPKTIEPEQRLALSPFRVDKLRGQSKRHRPSSSATGCQVLHSRHASPAYPWLSFHRSTRRFVTLSVVRGVVDTQQRTVADERRSGQGTRSQIKTGPLFVDLVLYTHSYYHSSPAKKTTKYYTGTTAAADSS